MPFLLHSAAAATASTGVSRKQQVDQPRQGRAQIGAFHHHVQHAVLKQIFRALEAFRQFFAHGLGDDPRAGKADLRARLGDLDIAQHGKAGGDAAEGGIGQHHDIGQPRFLQHHAWQ